MKISEIQTAIFEQTGLMTTVRKNTGSMKHHITIRPQFQGGTYPNFPNEWVREFGKQFKPFGQTFTYATPGQIDIPSGNITDFDPIKYKKESKPKPTDPAKPSEVNTLN